MNIYKIIAIVFCCLLFMSAISQKERLIVSITKPSSIDSLCTLKILNVSDSAILVFFDVDVSQDVFLSDTILEITDLLLTHH